MRAVDVAMLVRQAVAAVAHDGLDAVGQPLVGRKPAHAFGGAQARAVLDGVQEPIGGNAEGNTIVTCGNMRKEPTTPRDVHAVVRPRKPHLAKRQRQQHDHAAGHLAVAAALRPPALHDERGLRVRQLARKVADSRFACAGDARGPRRRFRHAVVPGAPQVIKDGKPLAAPARRQRVVSEADAAFAQEIPGQRVVRKRQLVQKRRNQRPVGARVDGQPCDVGIGRGFAVVLRYRAFRLVVGWTALIERAGFVGA